MNVALLLMAHVTAAAAEGEPARVDLARHARIFASHATPGEEFQIGNAMDGNPETKWVGEGHPLSFQPTSVVLAFDAPWSSAGWCSSRRSSATGWR